MKRKLVYTKINSEEIVEVPDKNLEKLIVDNYDFEIGYVPEGYNLACLLVHDDNKDSRKDIWKVLLLKSARKINKTITLDNAEEFDENAEKDYEIMKELDGNYEDVINTCADLIKKYRDRVEEKVESKVS